MVDETIPGADAEEANALNPEKDFILSFESLPGLWDTTHPSYTNKYKRNDDLAKLLYIFKKIKPSAQIEDVKKKINSLRSNYRRELKKVVESKRSGAGTDEIYCPKLWYFPYLHFLHKLEQPVGRRQNEEGTEDIPENTTEEQPVMVSSMVKPPPPSSQSIPNKRKKTQEQLLETACKLLAEPCQAPFNPIAVEWSQTLDRLDPMQRLYAKKAINDVLYEAELKNLNRYSVVINGSGQSPSPTNISISSPYPYASTPQTPSTSSVYRIQPPEISPFNPSNYGPSISGTASQISIKKKTPHVAQPQPQTPQYSIVVDAIQDQETYTVGSLFSQFKP